jgi:diadenosine tetraphosphate (Ap4A) HIT family hydrolase
MVGMAHKYNDVVQSVGEHLHTHVYPEKEGDKGSYNVDSLLMKTLTNLNVLREGEAGQKLRIFFDNC